MNSETISLIILVISFLGIILLIFRKIPALAGLFPISTGNTASGLFPKLKNKIKDITGLESFSPEIFLQKIISQARVWSLRADHKTANWLKTLRQKTQKKKLENGSYWEKIKNSKDFKK